MVLLCQAQSHGVDIKPPYVIESQLEPAAFFEQVPWLLQALRELQHLQETGRNRPGLGDLRISSETTNFTRRLLSLISVERLTPPRVAPISGGGVGLSWTLGGKEVLFTVFPNEERFSYMLTNESDEVVSDGILTLEQKDSINSILGWTLRR